MEIFCHLDLMFEKLEENLNSLNENLKGKKVTIVCASKHYSVDIIRKLYSLGITHFGESRADDLLTKKRELQDLNITWHFIGSLQTNKVKSIINEISYLHSLDRESLLKAINKYRIEPLNCFIQTNLALEDTKRGLFSEKLKEFIPKVKKYDKIKPIGLMQMGVYNNLELTKKIYKQANRLNKIYDFKELSMGMSDDYLLALSNGATFIRIGSLFIK